MVGGLAYSIDIDLLIPELPFRFGSSMSDVVIRAEGLGKKYTIGHTAEQGNVTLRDTLVRGGRNLRQKLADMARGRAIVAGDTVEEFWALKDVSFELRRGEVLGIIGRNGAGKSTLLKILSRITEPTEGRVTINGRVASLLEVGTGFHPELTGRENVYLNGAILGMTHAEVRRKFDEIVAFAEVEKFLDTPVKRYSSGMYVRLAFAVAAHLEPEILIVDEVLAVGDIEFQKKCLGKINEVAREQRTVLFVSHNTSAIRTLTENCILLEHGRISSSGPVESIINRYLTQRLDAKADAMQSKDLDAFRTRRYDDQPLKILEISVDPKAPGMSGILPQIALGTKFNIELHLAVCRSVKSADLGIIVRNSRDDPITDIAWSDRLSQLSLQPGCYVVTIKIDDLPLAPGRYFLQAWVSPNVGGDSCDNIRDYPLFAVVSEEQIGHYRDADRHWGPIYCQAVQWNVSKRGGSQSLSVRAQAS
jgi:lipopolysaccharide transport system ATP-binding protein